MLSLFCSMVILTKFPLTFIFIFIILNCFQQCLKKLLYLISSSQRRKAKFKGLRIRNWVLSPEQDIYINYTSTTKTLEMIWRRSRKNVRKRGSGKVWIHDVFWIWCGYPTHELTSPGVTCIAFAQYQTQQNSITEWVTFIPRPTSYCGVSDRWVLLGEGISAFFEDETTDNIPMLQLIRLIIMANQVVNPWKFTNN